MNISLQVPSKRPQHAVATTITPLNGWNEDALSHVEKSTPCFQANQNLGEDPIQVLLMISSSLL